MHLSKNKIKKILKYKSGDLFDIKKLQPVVLGLLRKIRFEGDVIVSKEVFLECSVCNESIEFLLEFLCYVFELDFVFEKENIRIKIKSDSRTNNSNSKK